MECPRSGIIKVTQPFPKHIEEEEFLRTKQSKYEQSITAQSALSISTEDINNDILGNTIYDIKRLLQITLSNYNFINFTSLNYY